jgi:hypothetical protein
VIYRFRLLYYIQARRKKKIKLACSFIFLISRVQIFFYTHFFFFTTHYLSIHMVQRMCNVSRITTATKNKALIFFFQPWLIMKEEKERLFIK